MTRVLVLGNSHMGCVRASSDQISAAYPDLDVSYFGVPGARFTDAFVTEDGVFRTTIGDESAKALAIEINGHADINLTEFDNILVIGHRFRLNRLLRLGLECDVAEWEGRTGELLVSESFFSAGVSALAYEGVEDAVNQFKGRVGVTFAAAAYPSEAVQRSDDNLDNLCHKMIGRPNRAKVFDLYQAKIAVNFQTLGHYFVAQPDKTMSGPFSTIDKYSEFAGDLRHATKTNSDKRHMNADYGFLLFQAYYEQELKP